MADGQPVNDGYLDTIRKNQGLGRCRSVFYTVLQNDREKAIALINDKSLTFPCLFFMLPDIKALGLLPEMNSQNAVAINVVDRVANPQNTSANMLSKENAAVYPVLKWILETGYAEDCINDEYERILDVIVSVLIHIYHDKSILPIVLHMIFERNKKGHYFHDLVWSYFEFHDPYILELLAEQLASPDRENADMAYRLLNPEAVNQNGEPYGQNASYEQYRSWLKENEPFLYFTEESLQLCSDPAPYRVDLESKYVHKNVEAYRKQPVVPSNDAEREKIEAFQTLSDEDQKILSDYSNKVYNRDIAVWNNWMQRPIGEQIDNAKRNGGAFV